MLQKQLTEAKTLNENSSLSEVTSNLNNTSAFISLDRLKKRKLSIVQGIFEDAQRHSSETSTLVHNKT